MASRSFSLRSLFSRKPEGTTAVAEVIKEVVPSSLQPVDSRGGWWSLIRESFTGAWQQNVEINNDTVASYWAVFSCVTLIAGDIAKMALRVMKREASGIWTETLNRPVLRKPNRFQTRAEFIMTWVISKLLSGNTYILKERDSKGFIVAMYVLDPRRVLPLVTPDGQIFYQIGTDNLAGVQDAQVVVPASEIIHDKMYPLYHPLVGVSPIYACGVPAMQGAAIQQNSAKFFQNMSRPSGILTAPGSIGKDTAERLKEAWETNYGSGNVGKVAVLGDNLKYEALSITAVDSQLIEQLKMTAEMVCACFHVPGYKIGVGQMPTVNNTAALNQQYYDQCLQYIIESMEARLDEGLELPPDQFETWFDLSGLLRMDPDARYKSHSEAVKGGWKKPNEARIEENMAPVDGGDTPYMQQQNYALAALSARDKRAVEAQAEGSQDVQATAMNGAQVTSLQAIVLSTANGEMPKETAKATIAAAFPLLTPAQIDSMIDPIDVKPPTTPAPTPAASAAMPSAPSMPQGPMDDDPEDDEAVREFFDAVIKGLVPALPHNARTDVGA